MRRSIRRSRALNLLLAVVLALTGLSVVAAPAEAADYGRIAGTVTGTGGVPLDPDSYIWVSIYAMQDGAWTEVNGDYTDGVGAFNIGPLWPGTYRIEFGVAADSGYLSEFWNDASTIETATDITVVAGQTAGGKDAQLGVSGHITGTVTDPANHPVEGFYATAFRWNPSTQTWDSIRDSITDDDGHYDVIGLAPGNYRLTFEDADSPARFLPTQWNGGADIELGAGETITGKNVSLTAGARITGTVTGPSNQPLAGIGVSAYVWEDSDWRFVEDSTTDAAGGYDIRPLPAGTYRIRFEPDGTYVWEAWPNAATLGAASDIVVTAGQTASGKNAQLAAGGEIRGSVTDPNGDPAGDVKVAVMRWNTAEQFWDELGSTFTDMDGMYSVSPLAAGTYRIQFVSAQLADEYWNNVGDLEAATDITITGTQIVTGKNAQLSPGSEIHGTVTDPDGGALELATVTAYRLNSVTQSWVPVTDTQSETDGRFTLADLPAGSYRIGFEDQSGNGYTKEYWDDAASLETATTIAVGAGDVVTGKDAQLSDVAYTPITNSTLPQITGTARVGSPLTASAGTWAPAGGLTFYYRWFVGDRQVADGTSSTYTPAGSIGKKVTVEVRAAKSGLATGAATSTATAAIVAGTLTNAKAPQIQGTPRTGAKVTATPGAWTPSGTIPRYQWLVAGKPVAGAVAASYTPVGTDVGKALTVRVTATKPNYTDSTVTSAAVKIGAGALKNIAKPKVTGKAKVGATLEVSPGRWSPAKVTTKLQWYAGAKAIRKATKAKLKLIGKTLKAVRGKAISVRVTVSAAGYTPVVRTVKVAGKVR